MERDSFIFYRSFYEAIKCTSPEVQLELYSAVMEYALYGRNLKRLSDLARGMFALMKPNLDVNIKRYENGKKGGRKPKKIAGLPVVETSVAAPSSPPAYSSFEDEVAQIKTDQIWCEPVCMQFRIDMSELDKRLDAFVMHCKVERENELHPSIKDAKRHFTSWMRKAYTITERKSNEQPKSDDYTYNGGFGGLD